MHYSALHMVFCVGLLVNKILKVFDMIIIPDLGHRLVLIIQNHYTVRGRQKHDTYTYNLSNYLSLKRDIKWL